LKIKNTLFPTNLMRIQKEKKWRLIKLIKMKTSQRSTRKNSKKENSKGSDKEKCSMFLKPN